MALPDTLTGFSKAQIDALSAKLNAEHVKKNPKGHDYVEGWWAIAEANRIFGFEGWHRELVSLAQVAEPYQTGDKWRVAYRATVRIRVTAGSHIVVRDGTGYGSGINKDLNDAHESAVKEAETDAMKRALMTFGNPFGLALYDKEKENVERTPAHLQPEALKELEAEIVEKLAVCTTAKAVGDVWKLGGFAGRLREVGEFDTALEQRLIGLFAARKNEIVNADDREAA